MENNSSNPTLREAFQQMDQWHEENPLGSPPSDLVREIAHAVFILMDSGKIDSHVKMYDFLIHKGLNTAQIMIVFAYCCVAGAKSIQKQNEAEKVHKF